MTFRVYLDNIQAKTRMAPDEFFGMAKEKGFAKGGKIVAKHSALLGWLKEDMGLGDGHANAIIMYLRIRTSDPKVTKKPV